MFILFFTLAFAGADTKLEVMKYCKKQESTYENRMKCINYVYNCAYEIETNNVLYKRKDPAVKFCVEFWETK